MDGARQDFLAGAAFAADQHTGIRGGDHARFRHQLGHPAAAKDDTSHPGIVALACLNGFITGRQSRRRELQGAVDFFEQYLAVERFGQVAENPTGSGVDRIGNIAVGGQQDDRQCRPSPANFLEQRQAILTRQANIADHDTRWIDGNLGQRLLSRTNRRHPKTPRPQPHGQQAQDIFVVVDHQHMRADAPWRHRHHRLTPSGRTLRGRGVKVRSMSARLSSFSCNSVALR